MYKIIQSHLNSRSSIFTLTNLSSNYKHREVGYIVLRKWHIMTTKKRMINCTKHTYGNALFVCLLLNVTSGSALVQLLVTRTVEKNKWTNSLNQYITIEVNTFDKCMLKTE